MNFYNTIPPNNFINPNIIDPSIFYKINELENKIKELEIVLNNLNNSNNLNNNKYNKEKNIEPDKELYMI